jgi:hypothetical protein
MSAEEPPKIPIRTIDARLVAVAGPSRATVVRLTSLTIASALLTLAVLWPFQLLVDDVLHDKPAPAFVVSILDWHGTIVELCVVLVYLGKVI